MKRHRFIEVIDEPVPVPCRPVLAGQRVGQLDRRCARVGAADAETAVVQATLDLVDGRLVEAVPLHVHQDGFTRLGTDG